MDLDFMPSPVEDRPGLLMRDPFHFSEVTLIIPPPLIPCLELFDGEHTDLDLRKMLVDITGELQVGDLERHLIETLSGAGFLHDENFAAMKEAKRRTFAGAAHREAAHAGAAYPEQTNELRATLNNYMGAGGAASEPDGLIGIAAPHVSPFGGWECYQSAYRALSPAYRDRIFVVLGTSHYGEPDRFGLTRKSFATPFGMSTTETRLVDELAARGGGAVSLEDYCHAVEHSIEFQIVFLQHLFGPDIRIVPVLCGSFALSIYRGGKPEDNDHVKRFLDVLGEIGAREGARLLWVLGIDMAHMGRRYGDQFAALADHDEMASVAERDKRRIESIQAGDADGFWSQVQENRDDLKWCGSSPLYTFLKAMPQARGKLLKYQQWNIDPQSVVSFAGMSFRA
jgi:AmmeMemoRadiSam system protein B